MAYKIKKKKLKKQGTNIWNVSLNRKNIDTVFYNADIPKEDVKQSLINHDGYNPNIRLNKAGKIEVKGKKT